MIESTLTLILAAVLAALGAFAWHVWRRGAWLARLGELGAENVHLRRQLEEQGARLLAREQDLVAARQSLTDLNGRQAALEMQLAKEREAAAEKLALLEAAERKLADAFRALAAEALNSNNKAFIDLARQNLAAFQENAKGELETRRQAVESLVRPIHEALEKVGTQAQAMEKERGIAYAALVEQVKGLQSAQQELRGETQRLVTALRRPEVRGRWGEMQLRRVAEMAGMQAYCDFYEQESGETDGRRQRPDMLVRLPGGKNVVIDAKAPVAAFLEAVENDDETERAGHMQRFTRHVREHVQALGSKAYWDQFAPAPEFVVLFLPGEAFFSAALQNDPELIEYASAQKVILATPTTLLALLKAVYYGWRQESLADNARRISELGVELYQRLGKLGEHWQALGRHLGQTVRAYNDATGSLESRVLVSARKFDALGVSAEGKGLIEPAPVESTPRMPQAAELTGAERE